MTNLAYFLINFLVPSLLRSLWTLIFSWSIPILIITCLLYFIIKAFVEKTGELQIRFGSLLKLVILNSIITFPAGYVLLDITLLYFTMGFPQESLPNILGSSRLFGLFFVLILCFINWFVFRSLFKKYIGQINNKKIVLFYIFFIILAYIFYYFGFLARIHSLLFYQTW